MDYDLLSLELPNFFSSTFQNEETSLFPAVANSLLGIQTLFGHIKSRIGVGRHSVTILNQLELLEHQNPCQVPPSREISTVIVVDRNVDFATVLLSPLTYEALLNEVFQNVCGTIDLDERVTKGDHVKLQLSSRDKMFAKIRAQHFSNIFASLSSYAKQLKQQQAKAASMSVVEMKNFIQKDLKEMQNQSKAVALHIGACEVIQQEKGPLYEYTLPLEHGLVAGAGYKETVAFLEEAMAQMKPSVMVLRLMCLASLCCGGIGSSDYERLKHQFLQAYGFKKLVTFNQLKRMGILTPRDALVALKASVQGKSTSESSTGASFLQVAKKLGLNTGQSQSVVASSQMQEDVSYVFNGSYMPLVCKLARDALTASKAALEEDLKELKVKYKVIMPAEQQTGSSSTGKVVLVYFVGGFTFSEVAAFRHLQTILGNQFIIAGTSSISGKFMMEGLK